MLSKNPSSSLLKSQLNPKKLKPVTMPNVLNKQPVVFSKDKRSKMNLWPNLLGENFSPFRPNL